MGNASGKRRGKAAAKGRRDGAEDGAEGIAQQMEALEIGGKGGTRSASGGGGGGGAGSSRGGGGYKLKLAKPVGKGGAPPADRRLMNETERDPGIAAPTSVYPSRKWSPEQDAALRIAVEHHKGKNWKAIAEAVPGRTHVQCLQRWKKVLQPGLIKGHWTTEEDELLIALVSKQGQNLSSWVAIAQHIPGRTAKQCRERWSLNLDPDIKKTPWEPAEDARLMQLHEQLGNKWAEISGYMDGRTENAVKTRYKSLVRAQQKEWTPEEDNIIIESKRIAKNRWVSIANRLPGRSKNAVRLRWKFLVSNNPDLELPATPAEIEQHQKAAAALAAATVVKEEAPEVPLPAPLHTIPSGSSTATHASNMHAHHNHPGGHRQHDMLSSPEPTRYDRQPMHQHQHQHHDAWAHPATDPHANGGYEVRNPYGQHAAQANADEHGMPYLAGASYEPLHHDGMYDQQSSPYPANEVVYPSYPNDVMGGGVKESMQPKHGNEAMAMPTPPLQVSARPHLHQQQTSMPDSMLDLLALDASPPDDDGGGYMSAEPMSAPHFEHVDPSKATFDRVRLSSQGSTFSRPLDGGLAEATPGEKPMLKEYGSTLSRFSDRNVDMLVDLLTEGSGPNGSFRGDDLTVV